MSNARRFRRERQKLSPEGRKPVDAYTAAELHAFLVADGVALRATHLPWAVAAYSRIAELERTNPDVAYQRVLGEVSALTGHGLPVHTGPIL